MPERKKPSNKTNYHLSSVHAAVMQKKIDQAANVDEMQRIVQEHADWLIGKDRERLIEAYRRRKDAIGHRA